MGLFSFIKGAGKKLFGAKEDVVKIEKKSLRVMKMETIKLDKPNVRQTKMKESSLV